MCHTVLHLEKDSFKASGLWKLICLGFRLSNNGARTTLQTIMSSRIQFYHVTRQLTGLKYNCYNISELSNFQTHMPRIYLGYFSCLNISYSISQYTPHTPVTNTQLFQKHKAFKTGHSEV